MPSSRESEVGGEGRVSRTARPAATSSLLLPETPRQTDPGDRGRARSSSFDDTDEGEETSEEDGRADGDRTGNEGEGSCAWINEGLSIQDHAPKRADRTEEGDRLYREAMVLFSLIGDDEGALLMLLIYIVYWNCC
jgi:hypothetical protein